MNTYNTALVGAGDLAQNFHLPILSKLSNINLIALGDRTYSKGKAVAAKFNIPNVYTDIDRIVDDQSIDTVVLTTPTALHYEQALKFIDNGKNIFIEKPVAVDSNHAQMLAEAAEKNKVVVMVGMNHRFRSDAKMMKNYAANGDMGDLFYIKAGWMQRKDGTGWQKKLETSGRKGVLTELGLSLIDSVLWLMDFKKVASVHASNFHRLSNDYEDLSVARINFEDGSVAVIEVSWAIYSGETTYYCNTYGNLGSSRVNPFHINTQGADIAPLSSTADKRSNAMVHRKSYESELKHFFYAVGGHVPVISTVEEAAVSLKMLEAMYASAESGREVVVVY
jgi:predicted dehydrogenase